MIGWLAPFLAVFTLTLVAWALMRVRLNHRILKPDIHCYRCAHQFGRLRPRQLVALAATAAGDTTFAATPLCARCWRKLGSAQQRWPYYVGYLIDRRLVAINRGQPPDPREFEAFEVQARVGAL